MNEEKQIEFQDYTKSIHKIGGLLRTPVLKNICLDDVRTFNEFNNIFKEEEFRESIRTYRLDYGNQEVKKELKNIKRVINKYLLFYEENKNYLESIDNCQLMHDFLKGDKEFEKQEHEELVKINFKVTEFKNKHEIANWKFGKNSQEVKDAHHELIYFEKKYEKQKNKKEFWKNQCNKKYEDNKELLSFKFSSLFEKFSKLNEILIEDYIDNKEYFNEKFSDELLELINEVFEPGLNSDDALKFFNDIGSIDINIRNRKTTKYYYLVYLFSEKIEDNTLRTRWENSILSYFRKEKSTYLKKRKVKRALGTD